MRIGKAMRAAVLPAAAVIVIFAAGMVALTLAQVITPAPAEVQARGSFTAPGNVQARNGDNIGEVIVSWTPAATADRNRVGWANMDEVREAQAAGDWLESFNFVDLGRTKRSYTVKRLAPGVWHAFIVATRAADGTIAY